MKLLVTGGAGFIGSHLVEKLLAVGDRIRVVDDLSTGKRENLVRHEALEFIEGDIRDAGLIDRCAKQMDAVVHLAAVASVQASMDDPVRTHQVNFDGTLNLLEASRRHGVKRFIYACSAAVYGDTATIPVPEETTPKPLSPYAVDKLSAKILKGGAGFQVEVDLITKRKLLIFLPEEIRHQPDERHFYDPLSSAEG